MAGRIEGSAHTRQRADANVRCVPHKSAGALAVTGIGSFVPERFIWFKLGQTFTALGRVSAWGLVWDRVGAFDIRPGWKPGDEVASQPGDARCVCHDRPPKG